MQYENLGKTMNEYDRANLQFLLNASPETLADWYESVSEDDVEYAMTLLQRATMELMMRPMELSTESPELSEANQVLSKFRLQ